MDKKYYFMVGPTAIPERVLHAMNKQIISHRTKEFSEIYAHLSENLKKLFQTKNDVITLTSSGTGAMEAAIQNCFSPGDEVVVPVLGEFSERFALMAEAFNLKTVRVDFELGEQADLKKVLNYVNKNTKGVLLTHNESATGVCNDIKSFGNALKDTDTLLICDAVSSAGGIEIKTDEWNIDVVFTSSQKALMTPPGLSFITLSEKAWEKVNKSNSSKFYFDLIAAKKYQDINQNPWTPAISLIVGADEALNIIMEEGVDNVFYRHKKTSNMVVEGLNRIGFNLFLKDKKYASYTVNTFSAPGKAKDIVKDLNEKYGIVISGGQSVLSNDTFRVGTMGYVSELDVQALLYAFGRLFSN
jgi:aspartate aminotransferase-like enzyme